MEVAVQQPSEECTAIFTVCIVEHPHLPVQRQHTKPTHSNSGMDSKTVPASKIKGQCAANRPDTLIVANRSRSDVSDIGFTPIICMYIDDATQAVYLGCILPNWHDVL